MLRFKSSVDWCALDNAEMVYVQSRGHLVDILSKIGGTCPIFKSKHLDEGKYTSSCNFSELTFVELFSFQGFEWVDCLRKSWWFVLWNSDKLVLGTQSFPFPFPWWFPLALPLLRSPFTIHVLVLFPPFFQHNEHPSLAMIMWRGGGGWSTDLPDCRAHQWEGVPSFPLPLPSILSVNNPTRIRAKRLATSGWGFCVDLIQIRVKWRNQHNYTWPHKFKHDTSSRICPINWNKHYNGMSCIVP